MIGKRMMMGGGQKLPYDAEVEYLAATGTQWIDSGIQVNYELEVTIDAQADSTGCWFFGGRTAYHNSALGLYSTPTSGYLEVNYGNVNPTVSYGGILQKTEYSMKQGVFYTNGNVAYRNSQQTFQSMSTIYIGNLSINEQGVPSNVGLKGRIFSFEISRGDNKLRDMIPVRFTNELGQSEGAMYDRVSKQLFRNQGNGSFIVGRDINPISARSYVTDGLIAMWDGIENAGWGVHDASAMTWKDLSGNNYDLTAPQSYQWGQKYCDITAGNMFSGDAEVITPHATTEFVGCFTQAYTRTTNTDMGVVFDGRGLGTFFLQDISSSNDLLLICRSTITGSAFYVRRGPQPQDAVTRYVNTPTAFSGYGYKSTTKPVTVDNLKIYVDGIERNGSISTYWTSPSSNPTKTVYVGSTGKTNIRLFTVRLYSRALTADEIAANYAVDKVRFNLPDAT